MLQFLKILNKEWLAYVYVNKGSKSESVLLSYYKNMIKHNLKNINIKKKKLKNILKNCFKKHSYFGNKPT